VTKALNIIRLQANQFEIFHGFHQSVHENVGAIPQTGHECLLPNPYLLTVIFNSESYAMLRTD